VQDTPSKLAGELIEAEDTLKVASPAFAEDGRIPLRHSAYDENVSPEITWSKGPVGTKSYVLLMEDPDAKKPKPVVHWVLFNIPADVTALREGIPGAAGLADPKDARQAANTRGSFGYFGPRPPADGDHHYHFQVFALDTLLNLKPDAGRRDILDSMKRHVLAKGDLVGIFSKADAKGA
jgi:Raf kinase inhibitor-like YbhB/YbcL family protein